MSSPIVSQHPSLTVLAPDSTCYHPSEENASNYYELISGLYELHFNHLASSHVTYFGLSQWLGYLPRFQGIKCAIGWRLHAKTFGFRAC